MEIKRDNDRERGKRVESDRERTCKFVRKSIAYYGTIINKLIRSKSYVPSISFSILWQYTTERERERSAKETRSERETKREL